MELVSMTAVGAFNVVGSILVVALLIAPPAAAYLLTDRHENTASVAVESDVKHLHEHLRWDPAFSDRVVLYAEQQGLAVRDDGQLRLTAKGRQVAGSAITTS